LRTDAAWELLHRARAEGFDVAAAIGVALDRTSLEPALGLRHPEVMKTATGSTFQSLTTGRDDEIDDIAGAISEMGRKAGVATPVNDALHLLVQVRRATQSAPTLPTRPRG
jgi:ketopantoate reductase